MLALFMGAFGTTAMAAPITGSFSKSAGDAGSVRCVSLAGAVVGCGSAEAIDFGLEEETAGEAPTPGVAGAFTVTASDGDFAAFLDVGDTGSIKDFAIGALGNANYPVPPVLVFELADGGNVRFDLTSITVLLKNNALISMVGLGTFFVTGYDPTPGEFVFSLTKSGSAFSFAASQTALPEPATMALFGLGLAGLGVRLRRRLAK